jgi:hypothetical protein
MLTNKGKTQMNYESTAVRCKLLSLEFETIIHVRIAVGG